MIEVERSGRRISGWFSLECPVSLWLLTLRGTMLPVALGWSSDELKHLFRAYLRMLDDELAGRPYVKADYNREVQGLTGRSRTSVEFKFANVSGVLDDLGLDWVQGYVPRFNYQRLMVDICAQLIDDEFPHLKELPQRTKGVRGVQDGDAGGVSTNESHKSDLTAAQDPSREPSAASAVNALEHVDETERGRREDLGTTVNMTDVLTFESMWERACGGASAAISMHTRESAGWPKGASAPGGDEVLNLIREGHMSRGPNPDEIDVVVLVGGPGNGKSQLLRVAQDNLKEIGGQAGGVALRRYRYRYQGGHRLVVVNDASIPAEGMETADGELVNDVASAIDDRSSAFLAVNRGRLDDRTLHEEAQYSPAETRAREVLKWVHDASTGVGSDGYVSPVSFRRWDHEDGSPAVRCFIVLMDACSLLEQRAKVTVVQGGEPRCDGYTIAPLRDRDKMQENTPGGWVLGQFALRLAPWADELPEWHPIRANVESLQDERQRAGIGTWLRAGELAGGRKVTYRELWGAYVRAAIGELPEVMTSGEAERTVLASPEPTSYPELRQLAHLRTHQALVGVTQEGSRPKDAADHPVLRLTTLIDPVRDAEPSWARPVHEAMAFRDPDVGPLATLRESLKGLGRPLPFETTFDAFLDEAFVEHVKVLSSSARRIEEAWYGAYLLRLYALSLGQCAFREELELWAREWRSTQNYWQEPLAQAIRTLLFPAPKVGASMLLPALQPRAVPFLSAVDTPQLVRQVNTQHILQKVRRGDELAVRLDIGDVSAEIDVDFALLLEAMACAGGGPGVTQHAPATLPRLERFRAALLRHDSGQGYAVVDRENVTNVETNHV